MDSADRIETVRRDLRYTYADNLTGLKALYASVRSTACAFVEITGTAHEGGSANGVTVFERLEYLSAVLDVLCELDSAAPAELPPVAVARFARPAC